MKKYLFSFLLLFSFTAFSQTWEELDKQVIELYEKGEYEKAIPIAERAAEAVKKALGETHSYYATILNNLTILYRRTGQNGKLEPLYLEIMELRKKTLGETHPDYATSLYDLAILYYNMNQNGKAEPLFLEVKEIRRKTLGENHPDYATCLNNLALLYVSMGQYKKAEPLYLESINISKNELGATHPYYATSLNNLAGLYKSMGQYEKAEPLYLKSIDIMKESLGIAHPDYATCLNNLALLYESMGQYEKSEPLYLKSKEIRKKALGEIHPGYANSLNNLAFLYQLLGQYEKAEPLNLESINILKNELGATHPDYATGLNNLAGLYESMGQYGKAELLYLDSKDIRKKALGNSHPDYASSLNNLAGLYESMGQYGKAELLYLDSKDIRKKALGNSHSHYATSLNNLAILYQRLGEYEKAEPLYLESKDIRNKALGNSHPDYAASLNNLAALYESMGQYGKAELLYLDSKDIRKKALGNFHPDYASSLNNLAFLYQRLREFEKAEPLYLESKDIRKKALGNSHPDYAASLKNLAVLYEDKSQFKKTELLLMISNQTVTDNIKRVFNGLSEKEKGNYLNNNIDLNNTNNSLLFKFPKASTSFYKECYNLQLLLKSLSLADSKAALNVIRKNTEKAVIKLYENWQTNKNILAKQYALAVSEQRKDLTEFEDKTESLEKELNRKSSAFKKNHESYTITAQKVWNNLQEKEAAIEFVKFALHRKGWTDSVMYAAYILKKNDSIPLFISLCEEKQIQQLFDSAGSTATTMVNNFYRGVDLGNTNSSQFLGTALYKLIWEPLEPYLKGIKKVSYSPAGKLFSVAFQALPVDSNTVLMDKYELQQYTSTRQVALRTEEKQNSKPTNITLFGNASFTMDSLQLVKQSNNNSTNSTTIYTPKKRGNDSGIWDSLPGTAEEVKKINQLFDENRISTKTFVQTTASEENLKALSGNSPQILHIATHGFFLPDPEKKKNEMSFGNENAYTLANDPLLRSGLILSGGNYAWSGKTPIEGVEDGIATAYEISQLNLSNTELVVLSACETALGDVKGSEGVFGLQRAFKMAGVKKMIVSLWQVPDKETAELMTAFYTYWMKGKTIEESFAQAQTDMRKKYSPFYWAAFVLVE